MRGRMDRMCTILGNRTGQVHRKYRYRMGTGMETVTDLDLGKDCVQGQVQTGYRMDTGDRNRDRYRLGMKCLQEIWRGTEWVQG